MAVRSGGKIGGGKTSKAKPGATGKPKGSKAAKPKREVVKSGKTSLKPLTIASPKAVKSPHDHSSNHGHAFGYFRMGIEKRK